MENHHENGFQYTYSAKEQAELRRIREKYEIREENKEENKMERLRRLDRGVTRKAQIISLTLGIVGALILGFGMSLIMSELSEILHLRLEQAIVVGVSIGVVGGILTALAYPVYQLVIKRERRKIAPEVISLTDELMK